LTTDVEEDEEEISGCQAEKGVDFWDGGLFLKVVEDGVFGELREGGMLACV